MLRIRFWKQVLIGRSGVLPFLLARNVELSHRRHVRARGSACRHRRRRGCGGFLCDLPPPRAPTHPAHDRSDHDGEWTQPPVTTPEVQAPKTAVPVFCGCFTGGCRSANRGVKMVPQFMEQHARQHHVAKEVQRKDKRRPTSDSIVNHDFNGRRRSAVFPTIEAQAGVAIVLPTCHTPGLPDAYRGGIS